MGCRRRHEGHFLFQPPETLVKERTPKDWWVGAQRDNLLAWLPEIFWQLSCVCISVLICFFFLPHFKGARHMGKYKYWFSQQWGVFGQTSCQKGSVGPSSSLLFWMEIACLAKTFLCMWGSRKLL